MPWNHGKNFLHFFLFIIKTNQFHFDWYEASTTMWFSRCKSSRSAKCFRSSRSKGVCISPSNESIRANRSDCRITAKPSAVEATCHRIRATHWSATCKDSDWRYAARQYGTKLYVLFCTVRIPLRLIWFWDF